MTNDHWDADVNARAYKRQLLDFLRNELIRYRPDIPDARLQRVVSEWLVAVSDVPTGTLHERISDRLMRLETTHPMRRTPRLKNGQQAFPDDCSGCQFADEGSACPVIHDRIQRRKRENIMSRATNAEELRSDLMNYAITNDCRVLQEELQAMRKEYEPLLNIGQFLLMEVEATLTITDETEAVKNALANIDSVGDRGVSSLTEALDELNRIRGTGVDDGSGVSSPETGDPVSVSSTAQNGETPGEGHVDG